MFAIVMYTIYGNLNWGGEAEKNLPWFEPVFWLIASSGAIALVFADLVRWLAALRISSPQRNKERGHGDA
ncbi:MAG: hypothetical protein ABFS23_06130 [Pseudomonadota bacterium]